METATWRALGTAVTLIVDGAELAAARSAVECVLGDVDRTYSRFRPDSELSLANARAGTTSAVSPLLAMAVETALRGARASDGLVDPTVGRAMRAIGYDDDFARILDRDGPLVLRIERVPGWQAVRIDPRSRRLHVPAGVELDLGSTGKALAADLAAAAAFDAAGGRVLVSLGGDIATAGEPPPDGWRVLVAESSETPPDSSGEVIALRAGAVATSSTTVRRWSRSGVALHHLVDPRTGLPAWSCWRTATVIARTCVDANVAATTAIVAGESAISRIESWGLAARLVHIDGSVRRVGTWPVPPGG